MLTVGEVASKQQYGQTPTSIISPCDVCIRPQPPRYTRLPDIQREGLVHIRSAGRNHREEGGKQLCVGRGGEAGAGGDRRERAGGGGGGGGRGCNCRRENKNWVGGGGGGGVARDRDVEGMRGKGQENEREKKI